MLGKNTFVLVLLLLVISIQLLAMYFHVLQYDTCHRYVAAANICNLSINHSVVPSCPLGSRSNRFCWYKIPRPCYSVKRFHNNILSTPFKFCFIWSPKFKPILSWVCLERIHRVPKTARTVKFDGIHKCVNIIQLPSCSASKLAKLSTFFHPIRSSKK